MAYFQTNYNPLAPGLLPAGVRIDPEQWWLAPLTELLKLDQAWIEKFNAARVMVPVQYGVAEILKLGLKCFPADIRYHSVVHSGTASTFTTAFNATGVDSDWTTADGVAGTNMRQTGKFGNDEIKFVTGFGFQIAPSASDADLRRFQGSFMWRFKRGDTIWLQDLGVHCPAGVGFNQDSANGVPVLANKQLFTGLFGETWSLRLEGDAAWTYQYILNAALDAAQNIRHEMYGPYGISQ